MAGLDPAIQHTIEMLRFFLDGRVEHGHDKKAISVFSFDFPEMTLRSHRRRKRPSPKV
jgi:hypothetical protein